VWYISKGYYGEVYQWRDERMVGHASRVIAIWNGQLSGTKKYGGLHTV
jgi:hypothetical protein